jgi:hypothetical protein
MVQIYLPHIARLTIYDMPTDVVVGVKVVGWVGK